MKLFKSESLFILGIATSTLAFASPVLAESQAPTFYGKVNVSLEQREHDGAGLLIEGKTAAKSEQWELNSNSSRLGVKGAFDLEDSDLIAIYQAEYEINLDDGGSGDTAFNQRNIFAGLRGAYGEVRYGKFDTPLKRSEGKVDQFNDLTKTADIDVLIGGQNRVNNIIQYISPKLAGAVTLNAAFIPAEGADVDQDSKPDEGLADSVSLSAVYDDKTFYAALAYDKDQSARRSIDGIKRGDAVRLVGGWTSGAVELGALFQQTTDNLDNSDKKDTSYLISGAYKSGKLKYKAQYGLSEGNVSDEQGTLSALGVDYALGKKATIYAYVSNLELDKAELSDNTIGIGSLFTF